METVTTVELELPGILQATAAGETYLEAASPLRTTAFLVGADMCALGLSALLCGGAGKLTGMHGQTTVWQHAAPLFFVLLALFAKFRLYSVVGLSGPEELRRSTMSSLLLLATLLVAAISQQGYSWFRQWPLFASSIFTMFFVPLLRAIARARFGDKPWWGHPAIIVGTGPAARELIREMRRDYALGLKPVAIVEDRDFQCELDGLPVFGTTADPTALRKLMMPYVVAAHSEIPQRRIMQMVERRRLRFNGVLIVQDSHSFSSLRINARSMGGMFALEVPREHALDYRMFAKRALDIVVALLIAIPGLPLGLLMAAAIRMSSPGPVLYGQRRIGRHGKEFKAWKFRSMIVNAEQALESWLQSHPEARVEWEANHKLRHDPRITRIGAFLRKSSLDEIPQIWNILRGEMSLVGPRPIVQAEVEKYGDCFELYTQVRGGLTGLWQVSGRNDTSYGERIRLDQSYVQNCSIWLDLCILFRTFGVVLFKKGAY